MRYSVVSRELAISQLQSEVEQCGGRNLRVASASKQIFCDLEPAAAAKLQAKGCDVTKIGGVKAVVMPPIVTPPPIVGVPTYRAEELILAIGFEEIRLLTDPPLYGSGMNLAIIGTGIRETHQKINGRVIFRKNYTSALMRDGYDHDTGVCDIILAFAPQCNILNLKVLDDKGEGSEEDVALAIDDCITLYDTDPDIAPTVINLSLGGPDDGNPSNPLRVACRAATDRGIWLVASAGNAGPFSNTITSPACEKYVFAAGSVSYEPFVISEFSGRGPTMEGLIKPDGVFFGENIEMASSKSDTSIVAKSGTSFAAPFCSGIAIIYHEGTKREALWKEATLGLPAAEMYYISMEELLNDYLPLMCIKPEGVPVSKDSDYGHGLIWGPLAYRVIFARPLIDVSALMGMIIPILGIGLLGMVITPTIKSTK